MNRYEFCKYSELLFMYGTARIPPDILDAIMKVNI
jgi:hypothetical protein